MLLKVPMFNLRFIDSLNHISMALAKMPKAYGIKNVDKGTFPHLFNIPENQNYVGPLPPREYYDPESMSFGNMLEFNEWYSELSNRPGYEFNFQKELSSYCRMDVDILRRCCLKHRELFVQTTNVDPFTSSTTLASACNLVFRQNFLKPGTIGIIPPRGYRGKDLQSILAVRWLSFLARERSVDIQHNGNTGEKRIGTFKADGYYKDVDGREHVLEVNGCWYHGCTKCFARSTVNTLNGCSMQELREKTRDRRAYLESKGYIVEEWWECELEEEEKNNEHWAQFKQETYNQFRKPLNPRDGFFGGRTEAIKLYKEVDESVGEKILYYDVTSLYPWVNKYCKYPVGHPNVITSNFKDLSEYFGVVYCTVLPPKKLYYPVLPCKAGGKLMFTLCHTCANENSDQECRHSDKERSLSGVWTTMELQKAVEKGYVITNFHEVYHYPRFSQYDPIKKTGGLFAPYIMTFQGLKQEASGWPADCITDVQRQAFITDYYEREGVLLNPEKICHNPGQRSQSKLTQNNFWGKLGQRDLFSEIVYISDPKEFFDLLQSDQLEVDDVNFFSENLVSVQYKMHELFAKPSPNTNVVLAVFTTAHARLKLYSYLEQLQRQVLYMDTDSVIFSWRPGQFKPTTGNFLGDLTSELGEGDYITKFCSTGPKSYAYVTKSNKSVCHVKGITLNVRNSVLINAFTFSKLLKDTIANKVDGLQKISVKNDNKITRDKKTFEIENRVESKDFKLVYNKRVLFPDFTTLPYGHVRG
jgi:hypothetical protein